MDKIAKQLGIGETTVIRYLYPQRELISPAKLLAMIAKAEQQIARWKRLYDEQVRPNEEREALLAELAADGITLSSESRQMHDDLAMEFDAEEYRVD